MKSTTFGILAVILSLGVSCPLISSSCWDGLMITGSGRVVA